MEQVIQGGVLGVVLVVVAIPGELKVWGIVTEKVTVGDRCGVWRKHVFLCKKKDELLQ